MHYHRLLTTAMNSVDLVYACIPPFIFRYFLGIFIHRYPSSSARPCTLKMFLFQFYLSEAQQGICHLI